MDSIIKEKHVFMHFCLYYIYETIDIHYNGEDSKVFQEFYFSKLHHS